MIPDLNICAWSHLSLEVQPHMLDGAPALPPRAAGTDSHWNSAQVRRSSPPASLGSLAWLNLEHPLPPATCLHLILTNSAAPPHRKPEHFLHACLCVWKIHWETCLKQPEIFFFSCRFSGCKYSCNNKGRNHFLHPSRLSFLLAYLQHIP